MAVGEGAQLQPALGAGEESVVLGDGLGGWPDSAAAIGSMAARLSTRALISTLRAMHGSRLRRAAPGFQYSVLATRAGKSRS